MIPEIRITIRKFEKLHAGHATKIYKATPNVTFYSCVCCGHTYLKNGRKLALKSYSVRDRIVPVNYR